MATARASLFARARTLSAVVVASAAVAVVGPATVTHAAPTATLHDVEARIAALNDKADRIVEAYDGTRDKLTALQRQQRVAADTLGRDQASLAQARQQIAATANAAYRTGGLSQLNLMTTTDPQEFLDQASTLDQISRFQSREFADVTSASYAVRIAQAHYAAQAAQVKATLARITDAKSRIEQLLAQERALLASMKAADRARYDAQRAAEAASQIALRGSYDGPASGRAAAAVRFAYAQLGKPYVYGAAGPDSYDCSGLTMASWAAAGVSLPHNAAAQQSVTRYVSSPQPGDLVFFGSPAYHVGIYIGGGRMIAAPHTGTVVQIQSIFSGFSGFGRP